MLAYALAETKRQYSRSRGGGGSAAQGTAFAFRSSVRVETIGTEAMSNHAQQIFKPEFRFGLGGVSLGNEFNKHTDKEAGHRRRPPGAPRYRPPICCVHTR